MPASARDPTRRELLGGVLVTASTLAACATPVPARAAARSSAPPSERLPPDGVLPLPFDPSKLRGLSERMITSHHRNNYAGAVKNLAACTSQLAALRDDTPGFVVAALRERELVFRNSKSLHEAYFGNLGGDGRVAAPIAAALTRAFGSAAAWEQQFRAAAKGLGGGSGWVMLSCELSTGELRIVAASNHSQAQAEATPLLVLDMYEHAYQIDYAADAARYVDAFFANVQWDEVQRRWDRAQRLIAARRE